MVSSSASNVVKHNIETNTTSGATETPNSSGPSHDNVNIDPNNPSATFGVAPSLTPITTTPAESDSSVDSPESGPDDGEASGSSSRKKGRGKVELKKMEKESNLLVTFSKRRSGLFKKANELCILCGVQCAVVVFSPAKKVFSFGHPSVDAVVDRYLTGNLINPVTPITGEDQVPQNQVEGDRDPHVALIESLTAELTDIMDAYDFAKKNSQSLDKRRAENQAKHWFERPLQQMDFAQLEHLRQGMMALRMKVNDQAAMRMRTDASSSLNPNPFQWLPQNYPNVQGAGFSINIPQRSNQHNSNEAGPSGSDGGNGGGSTSGAM